MTKEELEKEAIIKLSAEMRKQKARCDRYCGTWNSEDKDCDGKKNWKLKEIKENDRRRNKTTK